MKTIRVWILMLIATARADDPFSCSLRINKDFSTKQPLILKQIKGSNQYEFDNPIIEDSIHFKFDEEVLLACPGSLFNRKKKSELSVKCLKNDSFQLGNDQNPYHFNNFECLKLPQSKVLRNGQCAGDKSGFVIGFQLDEMFIRMIDICFDENKDSTLYAKHKIFPSIKGYQKQFGRIPFKDDQMFSKIDISKVYKLYYQKKIFSKYLERWAVDNFVNKHNYLARGHLAPKADFVFGSQQVATFHYANAEPQWQKFNSGNWNRLEMAIRNYAINKGLELTVYTGVYGTYEINGKKVFLSNDWTGNKIPVPLIFWKVVHDEKNGKVVAFVGLNDPHANPEYNKARNMCQDICEDIIWVSFKQVPQNGLIYCCEYEDFSNTVKVLPPLSVAYTMYS